MDLALIPYFEQPTLNIPIPGREAPLTIYSFGAMVAVGVLVAGRMYENRLAAKGCDPERGYRMVVWMLVAGFLGAHAFDLLFYHPQHVTKDPWIILRIWDGLSSVGGVIGGLIGMVVFMVVHPDRARGELPYFDCCAFVLPVGWFFGRIGCALAHDHPGLDSTFFLAIEKPDEPGLGFHDLGLYEAIYLIGMIVLFRVLDRKPRWTGFYVGLLASLYGVARLGLDSLRIPPAIGGDARYLGHTPAQFVALGFIAVGAAHLVWSRLRSFKTKA